MSDWEIKKTLGQCYGTGRKLAVGEEYFAALVEGENGFERRDFGAEYWRQSKPAVYCFWKSKIQNPDQKKKLFIDDEMIMSFFERLADETEPDKVNFRFALTLVLMRKRRLKYDSSRLENNREIWRLRVTGQDRMVEVVNPHLAEAQIEQLSMQIGLILQVDL